MSTKLPLTDQQEFVSRACDGLVAAGFQNEAHILWARFGYWKTDLVRKLYNDGEKTVASLAMHVRNVAQYPTI